MLRLLADCSIKCYGFFSVACAVVSWFLCGAIFCNLMGNALLGVGCSSLLQLVRGWPCRDTIDSDGGGCASCTELGLWMIWLGCLSGMISFVAVSAAVVAVAAVAGAMSIRCL